MNSKATGERFLVVGGCGFLGRHIVEALLNRGEKDVSVFDIVQRHFDSNVTFYTGDISKPEDVTNAIQKSGATAVFHTASPTHGLGAEIYKLVNETGTDVLLDACQGSAVKKLVYTSSAGVLYDGVHDNVNVDERLDYPANPLDAYNSSKVKAEKMVIAANGPDLLTCSIRPSGIFGPGDRQMMPGFYNVIKNGQTKWQIGDNDNLTDWTFVGNVVHAHLLAMDKLHTKYSYEDFRDPLPSIDLSVGYHRIPTSYAHPLGPNKSPTEADTLAAKKFADGTFEETDSRPTLRNRMDQFNEEAEEEEGGMPIAGGCYLITNGEPIYFWDWARMIWRNLGHIPTTIWTLPVGLGLLLASLAAIFSTLLGKEPGFTRYRVNMATQQRFYDIERARRLLGYEPIVGIQEGLDKWTEWYAGELQKQGQGNETAKTK